MADNIDFALNDHFYDFVDDWNYKLYLGNTFSINLHNSDMRRQTKGLDGCMYILIRKES